MSDEWDVKRVADLVVGDEVRDYGEIIEIRTAANWRHNYEIELLVMFGERNRYLPVHARVDVLRPDDPASSIYTNGDSLNECRACSVGAHDECVILSRAFRERNERLLQDDPLWCCCGPPTVEMSPMTEPRISRSLQEALAVIISNLTEQAEAIDTISEALVVDNCVPASLADAADSARDAIDSIGRFLP